jgi:hypothetical protein
VEARITSCDTKSESARLQDFLLSTLYDSEL